MLSGEFDHFGSQSDSDRCEPHHFYYSVSGSIAGSGDLLSVRIHLTLRLAGHTHGPPAHLEGRETDQQSGIVSEGADSIDFHYAVFYRQ